MSAAVSLVAIAAAVLFGALALVMALDVHARQRDLWRDEDERHEGDDDTPPPLP